MADPSEQKSKSIHYNQKYIYFFHKQQTKYSNIEDISINRSARWHYNIKRNFEAIHSEIAIQIAHLERRTILKII